MSQAQRLCIAPILHPHLEPSAPCGRMPSSVAMGTMPSSVTCFFVNQSFFPPENYVNTSLIYLESSSLIGIFSCTIFLISACPTTRLIIFLVPISNCANKFIKMKIQWRSQTICTLQRTQPNHSPL